MTQFEKSYITSKAAELVELLTKCEDHKFVKDVTTSIMNILIERGLTNG